MGLCVRLLGMPDVQVRPLPSRSGPSRKPLCCFLQEHLAATWLEWRASVTSVTSVVNIRHVRQEKNTHVAA